MSEHRSGFYKDHEGNWQPDRRELVRRDVRVFSLEDGERRRHYRRKADREYLEMEDHKQMIKDALEDFAAEHDGRI
ncbi:MAG: hypothetical protein HYV27_18750 [Candidatus Hydrogenedentes bacterium]|nr:hypothetical protein [Candidatus Hydrogenedentota bacterium]